MSLLTRLLVLMLTLVLAFGQNAPLGVVQGRVVNAATGEPLRKVTLKLSRTSGKDDPATASPDDEGRFAFRELEPGGYRLSAERTGYRRMNYGSPSLSRPGMILQVAAGQTVDGLVVKMIPTSILSGRVFDDNGEPMPNLGVGAYRWAYQNGKRSWTQAGGAQTNDRGEYRIAGLVAGRYRVSAENTNIGIGLVGVSTDAMPEKPEVAFGVTWFGNTADAANASAVELGIGEDRRGTDIRMTKSPTLRIRGQVTGAPDDKILMMLALRKESAEAGNAGSSIAMVQQKEGRFELKGLAPGSYLLFIRSATEVAGSFTAAKQVDLVDRHVDNLVIPLGGGATELSGVVQVAGGKLADLKNPVVRLTMTGYRMPDAPNAKPSDDGTFSLKNVLASRYRLEVTGLTEDAWIKSVKYRGGGIDPDGFDVDESGGKLEVVISRSAGRISGKVLDADDKPVAGAAVTLIPESGRESLARVATSETDGSFEVESVAPGKYKLLAWTDIEAGAHLDREFVKPFEAKAEAVTVEENARPKVTLRVVEPNKAVAR